jgi:hypothetical protein
VLDRLVFIFSVALLSFTVGAWASWRIITGMGLLP